MCLGAKEYRAGIEDVTLQLMDEKGFAAQRKRPDVTPVTGIGDDAVQTTLKDDDPTASRIPVLTVKKGNTYFALTVHGLPNDQAAEQSLAKQVVSGL